MGCYGRNGDCAQTEWMTALEHPSDKRRLLACGKELAASFFTMYWHRCTQCHQRYAELGGHQLVSLLSCVSAMVSMPVSFSHRLLAGTARDRYDFLLPKRGSLSPAVVTACSLSGPLRPVSTETSALSRCRLVSGIDRPGSQSGLRGVNHQRELHGTC